MSVTLLDARNKLDVALLEATSTGYWTQDEKNKFLHDALMVTAAEIQFKVKTVNLTLHLGITHYLCPDDMLCPLRVRYNPTSQLQNLKLFPADIPELEESMFGWRVVGSGEPSRFIFRSADYVQIWPPPGIAQDGVSCPFDYVPVPADFQDDSDVLDAPNVAIEAVVELAAFFALHKKDQKASMKWLSRFMQRKSQAQADQDRDNIFKTSKMRPADRFNKAHHATKFRRVFP